MDLLHYSPAGGAFGDPMPMYHNGTYHLYYLKTVEGRGLIWSHLISRNLSQWEECPEALIPEKHGTHDATGYLSTGSVVYGNGAFHAFYASVDREGKLSILRAVSEDGLTFEREDRPLFSRTALYRADNTWRDPQVFYMPEDGLWHMLFCARLPEIEGDFLPGVPAHAVSKNLSEWELLPPLDSGFPAGYAECPQLLPMNGRWALLYYWHETRVRTSPKPFGPYEKHGIVSPCRFDFMAGKALQDGERTVLFGWIPRKSCDCSERIWGGCCAIPRVLRLDDEGRPLVTFLPETLSRAVPSRLMTLPNLRPVKGSVFAGETSLRMASLSEAVWDPAEPDYVLETDLIFEGPGVSLTLLLRGRDHAEAGYLFILDTSEGRLSVREHYQWDQRPELAGMPFVPCVGEPFHLVLVLHGDILEAELNRRETLTYRLMKHTEGGSLSFAAEDGPVRLESLTVRALSR